MQANVGFGCMAKCWQYVLYIKIVRYDKYVHITRENGTCHFDHVRELML